MWDLLMLLLHPFLIGINLVNCFSSPEYISKRSAVKGRRAFIWCVPLLVVIIVVTTLMVAIVTVIAVDLVSFPAELSCTFLSYAL